MRIKASDLRIGNWVIDTLHDDEPFVKIDGISGCDEDLWNQYHIEYQQNKTVIEGFIKGIPLTPELLEKCGFQNRSQSTDYYFVNDDITIGGTQRRLFPCIHGESGLQPIGAEIKYLHQLQNLYFALTGYELEINL